MMDSRARRTRALRRAVLLGLVATIAATAFLADARGEDAGTRDAPTLTPVVATAWPEDVVERFARLPLLDEGRVKPLNTYATFALHRINYRRSCKVPVEGQSGPDAEMRKLSPVEWLLDVWFFPEVARRYECFMVENDEVLTAIGLSTEGMRKKKRDRYSYEFLARGRARLAELYGEYHRIDPRDRDPVQDGIVELAQHLSEFEMLMSTLTWASIGEFPVPPELQPLLGGANRISFSEIVKRAPDVTRTLMQRGDAGRDLAGKWDGWVKKLVLAAGQRFPRFLPPTTAQVEAKRRLVDTRTVDPEALQADVWLSPGAALEQAARFPTVPVAGAHLEMLDSVASMVGSRKDKAVLSGHLEQFEARSQELARTTGQADRVDLEVLLFNSGLLTLPKHFYLLAFVLVAVTWAFKRPRPWYDWLVVAPALLIPTGMLIAGITIRSLVRGHPPMSNIYDTILFITGVIVVAALVIELINKRRIALAIAPAIGFVGMTMAVGYENLTREDTMRPLVAVLNTNFWLATHVTCIAIGYAGALLTAAIGNVFVLSKVVGFKKNDPEYYRTLGRMLYGMLAFGMIFSTVGTILGGIWANDSWGRFWGWDPKENGALMIVLWQLAMMHGRLGGFLKPWGLAMASAVLGMITAFSWWGVNLLGIGLHSYGFTQGVSDSLNLYYGSQLLIMGIGGVWWLAQRTGAPQKAPAKKGAQTA